MAISHKAVAATIRTAIAVLGGYAFAAAATIFGAAVIPLPRPEATLIATLLSFSFYLAAAIWIFAAHDTGRRLLALATITVVLGVTGLLLSGVGR